MSGKNQSPLAINWQSAAPFPLTPAQYASGGSTPSGSNSGTMASTNVIYSQVIDVSRMDNEGLEVTWTGTPTGTIEVMGSNSGNVFYALTFDPALAQPAGSAGGYLINLNQFPFKFLMLKYTNASGTGALQMFGQQKDLN